MAKSPIKRDKYAMMLRVKYGYTHERAREEIKKRITDLEISPQQRINARLAGPTSQLEDF